MGFGIRCDDSRWAEGDPGRDASRGVSDLTSEEASTLPGRSMRTWTPEQVARAAGARLVAPAPTTTGPERAIIDSREAGPGSLFVGLEGEHTDGGRFAPQALAAGAWGVLTTPGHADAARCAAPGALLAAEDPLAAMQRLATSWRRELGAQVIGVTGSTGKTSTKDLLLALLSPHRRTVASRANYNTEIGVPLEILCAPPGTEVLVLEMAMRGSGQIAKLAAVAEPDVGVIVSIGPVHLELLGTIEAIAAAKAELLAGLRSGGTAVVPARAPLLEPHLREDLVTITFGEGGDVRLVRSERERVEIDLAGHTIVLDVPFTQAHLRRNLLPAAAAARAVGVIAEGGVALELTAGRGQHLTLPGGVTLIDGCYNANPMSMRAALEDLVQTGGGSPDARSVAVLGDMLELGPSAREYHVELGEEVVRSGVEVLVTVGPLAEAIGEPFTGELRSVPDAAAAAELVPELVRPGDVVLVKGSLAVGLELVCRALTAGQRARGGAGARA
jgi:UDP-N-acetylmuramoyl-tripeptide--D-alanyl-D-alanine ligase